MLLINDLTKKEYQKLYEDYNNLKKKLMNMSLTLEHKE